MYRSLGWCLLLGALSQLPATARGSDDPNLDRARQKVEEGAALFSHGKYGEALDDFEEAHLLLPKNSRVYFNIGQALVKLRHRDQAAEYFELFLQGTADDPGVEDSKVDEARAAIKEARTKYAAVPLSIEGPGGTGRPTSLEVHVVDRGQDRTTASSVVYLPAKSDQHTFTVTAEGMQSVTFTVDTTTPGLQPAHQVTLRGVRRDRARDGDRETEKGNERTRLQAEHCRTIEEICKAAGFVKGGGPSGKGLLKDCVGPLIAGKTVDGVQITPDDLQGCVIHKVPRTATDNP